VKVLNTPHRRTVAPSPGRLIGRRERGAPGGPLQNRTLNEYEGVAAFFSFLSTTEIQSRLHQVSGYLPVTVAAYEATKRSGFYEKNPGREQPIVQMMGKEPTENSRGVRAVKLPELRDIQNEEIEAMLAGQQSAQQALDNAVARGNAAIRRALGG
jgi:sn-glycerol 3-phosphate transport system substrate-binding protein